MTDVISRQATQTEIDNLNANLVLASSDRSDVYTATTKVYFVSFDGTWNDRANLSLGPLTNVAILAEQAETTFAATPTSGTSRYYAGPGTETPLLGFLDAGFGSSVPYTAHRAAEEFKQWAQTQFEADANANIELAGASFSRGTITHTAFLNYVYGEGVGKRGTEIYGDAGNPTKVTGYTAYWVQPNTMNLGAHVMFDRVAGPINAAGDAGVTLPAAETLSVMHIAAQDEFRKDFTSESLENTSGIADPRLWEFWVVGAHSNIGGGYENNGIANYTLDMSMRWMQSFGLDLGTVGSQYQIGAAPLNVNNSYAEFTNGAYGSGGPGSPKWTDRAHNTHHYWQPPPQGSGATQDGSELNLINVDTNTSSSAEGQEPSDATDAINASGNTLIASGSYSVAIGSLWDVNTTGGIPAAAGYVVTEGLRPGNGNFGLDVNGATGVGLQPPVGADLNAYSLFAAQTNTTSASLYNLVPTDPLVLDLNGDGVNLTTYADSPVLFDADNDGGSLEQTGWVSAQDGIVVHDLNSDGKINSIRETLSEYYNGTPGTAGTAGQKTYTNGFQALKSLDSNGDNKFTSLDSAWSALRVWVDANHDGKTDAGELKTFGELGITAIDLNSTSQSGEVRQGNEVLARGSFTMNGTASEAVAANFLANPAGTTFTQTASGIAASTEGATGGATTSYVSTNLNAGAGESLNVTTLQVKNVTGGAGNDTLIGDGQDNWLAGNTGADVMDGGAGNDVFLFDANDTIIGGAGGDVAQVVGTGGVLLDMAASGIEMAVGGTGNDTFVGGGRTSVFVRAGDGNDVVVGSSANDALNGEAGSDLLEGAAGNDLVRGQQGRDGLFGGAGDDVLDGGLEDDQLSGDAGEDVLIGSGGDDKIDGGAGTDVAQYTGSYADYRITKVSDAGGSTSFRVVDTRTGRDGADTLTNIEKVSFSDVSRVDLGLGSPLPAKDILAVNSSGATLSRSAPHLIGKDQLLANDRDWDSATSALHITEVLDAKGGTVSLTAQGDVLFTPDPSYRGVMSFNYKVTDAQNNTTVVTLGGETEVMKAAVYLQTSDLPSDPLAVEQWYLSDINVMPVWQDYTGAGVRIGQFEPGGPFSTSPEVFDYRHPDLQANADKAWLNEVVFDPTKAVPQTFSSHATMVAGVMVAARNGEGGVGVAYGATLSGHYIQGDGLEVDAFNQELTTALSQFQKFDIVNNSWGATQNFDLNVVPTGTLETGVLAAVTSGRGGLGTVIVMAGGNERAEGANTNANALTANRAVITTGSINAPGDLGALEIGSKPFSNPGASILVSAPGSNIDSTSRELISDGGSTFGSQYTTSEGTSFAAPIVSGVVALMLQANPALGYRDVQSILALTATRVEDPNGTDWTYNGAHNWNGGGSHVSHDYGFGKVDALAAVRLAETWFERSTEGNLLTKSASSPVLNVSIPDGGAISGALAIDPGMVVESAQVTVSLTHQRIGDLIVKLISPSGTESVLVNRPGKAPGSDASDTGDIGSGTLDFSFNTTHVRGEDSGGNWTLQITDAITGQTGAITSWKLDLYGAASGADDVYVYTDEYATTTGRTSLSDTDGGLGDVINAAAVKGNSVIDLNAGATSSLAGKALATDGNIERAYGGDGNDTLTGNAQNNVLTGGRGSDVLSAGAGVDRIDGGRGDDSFTGGADRDYFVIHKDANSTDTIVDFTPAQAGEKIVLVGFELAADFSMIALSQEGNNTRVLLGDGQSVLLLNVSVSQVSEQNFTVATDALSLEQYFSYVTRPLWVGTAGQEQTLVTNLYGDVVGFALGGDDALGAQTANDLLDGGDGSDQLFGDYPGYAPNPGADWLEGGAGNDTLVGGGGDDQLAGGSGNDNMSGEAGNDVLIAATGDDVLYGGEGADVLVGGRGLDYLDAGDGNDIVTLDGDLGRVSGTVTNFMGNRAGGAGADVFHVLAGGGGATGVVFDGSGLAASNLITDFNPSLTGEIIDLSQFTWITKFSDLTITNYSLSGTSLTQVRADNGSSVLSVSLAGIVPSQLSASNFKFALPTAGAVNGTAGNDNLTGDAGANAIDGLAGTDLMVGRTGDDTYVVDNTGDQVTELPGGGYDTVRTSVSFTLSPNVEALVLTGSGNLNGTGNDQRDRLTGNAGNNILSGGADADEMVGGAGNDTYVVDNQLDHVYEIFAQGQDTVQSTVSWTLGAQVENLTLAGVNDINATGNDLANALTGNSGANMLDGAGGADSMAGGLGDDVYYVGEAGDVVTEGADAGTDLVLTAIDVTLAGNVEYGKLFGSATSLTGNGLDNILTGNDLANVLRGGVGQDLLDGSGGIDRAAFTGVRANYVVTVGDVGSVVADQVSGRDGADSLLGVERAQFTDVSLALDISGNAGMVAKAIGIVLGTASLSNQTYVGVGLQQADAGMSYGDLLMFTLAARLGAGFSNDAEVRVLLENLYGVAPDQALVDTYVGMITSGQFTQASMAIYAADTALNAANIDLVGLAETGLLYLPQ